MWFDGIMVKQKRPQQKAKQNNNLDKSRFGDLATNDFDFEASKRPSLSTAKTQLKTATSLMNFQVATKTADFDKLKIWVDLLRFGDLIEFRDLALIPMENPVNPETYDEHNQRFAGLVERILNPPASVHTQTLDEIEDPNDWSDEEISSAEDNSNTVLTDNEDNTNDNEDLFHFAYSAGLPYERYKDTIGLNQLYMQDNKFVICFTGKWLADRGFLGVINRDNIREALQQVVNLGVVNFNIERFIEVANIYACDICVDLQFDSHSQAQNALNAISSFCPISSGMYNNLKYARHGLLLLPKANSNKSSIVIYLKQEELDNSVKRTTRRTKYTALIGHEGIEVAEKTLRFEVHLWGLKNIRKALGINNNTPGVVTLRDVLNSTTPVILDYLGYFGATPTYLQEQIAGYIDNVNPEDNSLTSIDEILLARGYIQLLKDNDFDISTLKAHVFTEYGYCLSDNKLKSFNSLGYTRHQVLTFLVYHKPKTITIMLKLLTRLQAYYSTGMGVSTLG